MIQSHIKAKKIALAGLLGSLTLVLAFVEGTVPPIPMLPPGAKLGLSNIVTMYAAGSLGLPYALLISLIKGVFALFTRGYIAGLMSTGGGILSAIIMFLMFKKTKLSFIAIGISGAVSHNFAQLCVSFVLMGSAVIYYIPALIFFAIFSGILTGLVFGALHPRLQKINL